MPGNNHGAILSCSSTGRVVGCGVGLSMKSSSEASRVNEDDIDDDMLAAAIVLVVRDDDREK